VLFLGPDVAILAYVFGKKIGGAVYNSVHTYTVVVVCVACRPLDALARDLPALRHIRSGARLGA